MKRIPRSSHPDFKKPEPEEKTSPEDQPQPTDPAEEERKEEGMDESPTP